MNGIGHYQHSFDRPLPFNTLTQMKPPRGVGFWNIHQNINTFDLLFKEATANYLMFGFCDLGCHKDNMGIVDDILKKYPSDNIHLNQKGFRTGLFLNRDINVLKLSYDDFFHRIDIESLGTIISIYVCHFRSLLQDQADAEAGNLRRMRAINAEINETLNHHEIIIMGDFNLPHYHSGFRQSDHFNGTNYRTIGDEKTSIGEQYRIMYNPFSSLVGDISPGVPGSYYNCRSTEAQAWHLYDMIFISHGLITKFNIDQTEILTNIQGHNLLTSRGLPNSKLYSDHLPLSLTIKE